MSRKTIIDIKKSKGSNKLVCLTAYTAPFAKILDQHCDILLVGDSLGMVLYGYDSTLPVTVEMMARHGEAVVRASENALVVVDMPFGSYQKSPEKAYENAVIILQKTGCAAIKLEGGTEMAETVKFLTDRGVAVIGHIGLQPQSVNTLGGYKYQGKTAAERNDILEDARAIEAAGAFAIVLEGVTQSLAETITARLHIPTIGIGASPACDGQVLVTEDMLGLFDETPKFVKEYANMKSVIEQAVEGFAGDVRGGEFPAQQHCFDIKPAAILSEA